MILEEKALQYCKDVIDGKELAPDEVKIQCQMTLDEIEKSKDTVYPYFIDYDFLEVVESLLSLMNFATGVNDVIGKSILSRLEGFQAYFFYSCYGFKLKSDPKVYRYNYITLYIPRKCSKTWLTAVCMLIYLLTEDDWSELYSISLNRELASKVKEAMMQILAASPALRKHFKVPKALSGKLECTLTHSFYQPRIADANSNNSIRPSVFIADECGAFKSRKNIEAMHSGQRNVRNAIQMFITTAYAEDKSIFLDDLEYIKGVYHGIKEPNDRMFALLYYATKEHLWDDVGLLMATPLRIEKNYEEIRADRKMALDIPSKRDEYLTKSMNYFVPSNSAESYINIEDVKKCRAKEPIDWTGRSVYLGIDLSLSSDNTAVTMLAYDSKTETILADSYAFIPADRIEEKSRLERTNYRQFIADGKCFACGNRTIDYTFFDNFVLDIENKFKVHVVQIGFDEWNCKQTAQKLEDNGYDMVQVVQHSRFLHAPTKLLKEKILNKQFIYNENKLLEENFQNAKVKLDNNLNEYINKKYSNGKIDMVAAMMNALYCLQQNEIFDDGVPIVQ